MYIPTCPITRISSPWTFSRRGSENVSTRLINGTAKAARLIGIAYFKSAGKSSRLPFDGGKLRCRAGSSGDDSKGPLFANRQYSSMISRLAAAPADEPASAPPPSAGSPADIRLK
ncbi:hypothetical protein DJ90_6271 [Paenibacillus macerans]|uniref:Uncharacterized protein n=1 Tax=Paenibacillus macerans TaxID=44252 RepID=A0A090XWA3_PAEMA|nr:hypothetical protein DJ90_6271 [Paenibacillus macerans]